MLTVGCPHCGLGKMVPAELDSNLSPTSDLYSCSNACGYTSRGVEVAALASAPQPENETRRPTATGFEVEHEMHRRVHQDLLEQYPNNRPRCPVCGRRRLFASCQTGKQRVICGACGVGLPLDTWLDLQRPRPETTLLDTLGNLSSVATLAGLVIVLAVSLLRSC